MPKVYILKILSIVVYFFNFFQLISLEAKETKNNKDSHYIISQLSIEQKKEDKSLQNDLYLLGPGDRLSIKFIDAPELSGEIEILNDGNIQLPYIGSINVDNLSLEQAKLKIQNLMSTELIKPEVQIQVVKKRPIKISLIGEIERPGLYSLSQDETSSTKGGPNLSLKGMPTVVDAIQKAGGITQESDLKSVKVSRKISGPEKTYKSTEINLLKLILEGDQSQNIYLFDGDIINIKKAKTLSKDLLRISSVNFSPKTMKIHVIGEVNNPGIQEVSSETLLNQGIMYAGGPVNWRSDSGNVQLFRVNRNGSITKKKMRIDLSQGLSSDKNPPLMNGDTIIVGRNLFTKGTDALGGITKPIGDLVTTWTLFKLIGE